MLLCVAACVLQLCATVCRSVLLDAQCVAVCCSLRVTVLVVQYVWCSVAVCQCDVACCSMCVAVYGLQHV